MTQHAHATDSTQSVYFSTADGYSIHATLYSCEQPKASIVVSSATGVPQAFYRRFACYALQHGFQVLTFDYRGIAQSAPTQLQHFRMSYLDWGQFDLTAAIDYLTQFNLPIYMVGHSYGGQALGLSPNHDQIRMMYCFGTGAGWHGYMPLKTRIKVQFIWNIIFPPLVATHGYLPWRKFNMGADLPTDVYRQWRQWCKHPHYFFADPQLQHLHAQYAQVKTPIYAVAALDDDWALPASRQAFMQHYCHAPLHYIDIKAQDFGLKSIGHMGYFRQGAETLWDSMLNAFTQDLLDQQSA